MNNYKVQIHNRKIYITPRPKEDIEKGLVVLLNKPTMEGGGNFMYKDIEENRKEYPLPDLPEGYFIIGAFVSRKQNGGENKN